MPSWELVLAACCVGYQLGTKWQRWWGEVVESPSLGMLRSCLDMVLGTAQGGPAGAGWHQVTSRGPCWHQQFCPHAFPASHWAITSLSCYSQAMVALPISLKCLEVAGAMGESCCGVARAEDFVAGLAPCRARGVVLYGVVCPSPSSPCSQTIAVPISQSSLLGEPGCCPEGEDVCHGQGAD